MTQELLVNEEMEVVLEEEVLVHEDEESTEETLTAAIAPVREQLDFESLGINPQTPTQAKPGSEQKVLMLSARYAAGLPLWHNSDRYDHAPGHSAMSGLKFEA